MGAPALTAEHVRAFRIVASGLTRTTVSPGDLPLWDLGVQDRDGSARQSIGIRLRGTDQVPEIGDPAGRSTYAMAWSLRGSPHVHRRADLAGVAAALWPADEADAAARLLGDTKRLAGGGAGPLESYAAVADAFRAAITEPTVKGDASARLTTLLPSRFSGFCAGCGSTHVREMLFRVAALPGGLGLVPGTKPVVLTPLSPRVRTPAGQRGLAAMAAAYFRLFGTGTAADVGAHLGTSAAAIKSALPEDLVPVTVDGTRTQAREPDLDALRHAEPSASGLVRLLPQGDPLLQPRDRGTLTTDRGQQKALWPMIGGPGAVLTGGGVAGIWRTRLSGRTLTLTATSWRRLSADERTALEDEAELIGAIRGAARTRLLIDP